MEDKGFSDEPWKSFETKSPFVWAADACLGYFVTRDPAAWNGGQTEAPGDEYHQNVVLGDLADVPNWQARIHIFNFPFHEYGVFNCQNTSWPSLEFNGDEFQRWVVARMTAKDGWTPSNPRFGDDYAFWIQADYFGPPIVFD